MSSIAADETARPQTTMFGQPIKGFSDEAGRISSKLDAFLDEMALSGLIDPSNQDRLKKEIFLLTITTGTEL